jgi:hypothetical protein
VDFEVCFFQQHYTPFLFARSLLLSRHLTASALH